ncbi:MAG TPA: hypothetical protein VHZ32_08680 [Rhizomicrobium sp.]|nr:hypothetical protein [Rhizomicrobium sp.]
MSVEALSRTPAAPFAPYRASDRNAFLALLVLTWAGIVGGFGLDMADHLRRATHAYPVIVHLHALLFVGWLVLFTIQMLLIRTRRLDLHRRLGMAMAWLIPPMVVAGLAAAWTVERMAGLARPHAGVQFLSINITDMLGFVVLAGAAIWLRRDPAAHKRLMLLSLFFLSTAGFARLWLFTIGPLGKGTFWGFFITYKIGGDIPILRRAAYDLATRGRLHPAFVAGTGWVLANELAATWLYFNPTWRMISLKLLGLG